MHGNAISYSIFILNVVPEFPEGSPELLHVLVDGVEVEVGAGDVARALLPVQGIVQDHLQDGGEPVQSATIPSLTSGRTYRLLLRRFSETSSPDRGPGGWRS